MGNLCPFVFWLFTPWGRSIIFRRIISVLILICFVLAATSFIAATSWPSCSLRLRRASDSAARFLLSIPNYLVIIRFSSEPTPIFEYWHCSINRFLAEEMLLYPRTFLLLFFLMQLLNLLSSLRFQCFPSNIVFHCWEKHFPLWFFAFPHLPLQLSPLSPQLTRYYQPQWLVMSVLLLVLPIKAPCTFLVNRSVHVM